MLYFATHWPDPTLRIVDVANPSSPVELGAVPLPRSADGVDVDGDIACVTTGGDGLFVIDVSDPMEPTLLSHWEGPVGSLERITVEDNLAYMISWMGLEVVDLSDPTEPERIGGWEGSVYDVCVAGGIAYIAGRGFQILDVSSCGACAPDINDDGMLDSRDFIAFLNAFVVGDPLADFNGDGVVNSQDFGAFLNTFVVGC
jgi:hypothetical protein